MTAINCFVQADGVHFITDGITWMPAEKRAQGRLAKVHYLPWIAAAFASAGNAMAGPLFAALIGDSACETFDDTVLELPSLANNGVEELARAGSSLLHNCEIVLGGWSYRDGQYRAFALSTFSHNGNPPFTMRPVSKYMRPYPHSLMSATFDPAMVERDGMAILSEQRRAPKEALNGVDVGMAIGAFAQHSHLTRDGLSMKCIGSWPNDFKPEIAGNNAPIGQQHFASR